ncbi:MAG: hypothetical protein ACK5CL_07980 [Sphingomonadales bacterium]|jgi:hypothetical protein
MHGPSISLAIALCSLCAQGCGINNYFKAKKLKEEIAAENKKTEKLIKKRDEEHARLQFLKDSFQRQQMRMKGERP